MDSIQINQIISNLSPLNKIFQGTFPIDKLHKIPLHGNTAAIINTAPSTHKGKHWVAIMNVNNKQEYFDSYGLPPKNEISHHLKKRGNYTFNNVPTQNLFSAACGAHCIYFLFHRSKGYPLREIVKQTSDKTVISFVSNLYSPYNEFEELDNIVHYNQSSTPYFL